MTNLDGTRKKNILYILLISGYTMTNLGGTAKMEILHANRYEAKIRMTD